MQITPKIKSLILRAQRNEITEHLVYSKLAAITTNRKNKQILQQIADEEKKHHDFFQQLSNEKVRPSHLKILIYVLAARLLGLTFGIRLMEKGERSAQQSYSELKKILNDPTAVEEIIKEEEEHETQLVNLLESKSLTYVSSMVLGLNDALVELTGALAGFTLALQNTKLIATVGFITGVAASLSMAASEYLSSKEEADSAKSPLKASIYTGIAYLITVVLLIIPYFLLENALTALAITLGIGITIILIFNFYSAIAKNQPFWRKFLEMATISLGVAVINFFIGMAVKQFGGDI